jgi:SanA protein
LLSTASIQVVKVHRKRIVRGACLFLVVALFVLMVPYFWVSKTAENKLYTGLDEVPVYEVGLVPGTSPFLSNGTPNLFFRHRIETAAKLYKAGKIQKLLISGDNRKHSYNEPREMHRALVAAGVKPSDIVWDFAGFRTFDSVIRAAEVFGQKRFLVISQRFQAERAIFIGQSKSYDVSGYCAPDPYTDGIGLYLTFREVFARTRSVFDCYLLPSQPKFLGEPVSVVAEKQP